MVNLQLLRASLIEHEGIKFKPYVDTKGKLTIGIGHNLTDNGISNAIAYAICQEDINEAIADLDMQFHEWQYLDEVRQRVLVELVFNIGISSFLKFHKMLAAIVSHDYANAAYELKNSQWYNDVGEARGNKLINMLLLGQD